MGKSVHGKSIVTQPKEKIVVPDRKNPMIEWTLVDQGIS